MLIPQDATGNDFRKVYSHIVKTAERWISHYDPRQVDLYDKLSLDDDTQGLVICGEWSAGDGGGPHRFSLTMPWVALVDFDVAVEMEEAFNEEKRRLEEERAAKAAANDAQVKREAKLNQLAALAEELGVEHLERFIDTRFTGGARFDIDIKGTNGTSRAVKP